MRAPMPVETLAPMPVKTRGSMPAPTRVSAPASTATATRPAVAVERVARGALASAGGEVAGLPRRARGARLAAPAAGAHRSSGEALPLRRAAAFAVEPAILRNRATANDEGERQQRENLH